MKVAEEQRTADGFVFTVFCNYSIKDNILICPLLVVANVANMLDGTMINIVPTEHQHVNIINASM